MFLAGKEKSQKVDTAIEALLHGEHLTIAANSCLTRGVIFHATRLNGLYKLVVEGVAAC